MSDEITIPVSVLNPDHEHSFQKLLKGITPITFDGDRSFFVPLSIDDGTYIATYDTEDHGFYFLTVYSVPGWNSHQSTVAKRWAHDEDAKFHEFSRTTQNQEDLYIDNRKAVGLQQRHLDYARIDKQAFIVGQDDCFLIMNHDNLELSMQNDFDYDFTAIWPL